ncbi:MAG: F0F1 ATP synthase subunit B [Gemmatimonadaceae bacterium]
MRIVLVIPSLLVPVVAAAQEGEGGGGLLSPSGGLMFWTLVIFGVLLFILSRFAFPKIIGAVEARERALEQAISEARRDREEAARLLDEHRRRLEAARDEGQALIVEARQTAERVRAELVERAQQEQQHMLERARSEIQSERDNAIEMLRREAVDLAIAGASKVVEKNLDDDTNRRLVEGFLSSLSPSSGTRR